MLTSSHSCMNFKQGVQFYADFLVILKGEMDTWNFWIYLQRIYWACFPCDFAYLLFSNFDFIAKGKMEEEKF